MDVNLKQQAINASLWRLLQSLCVQSMNFVVQLVLARLLLPKDFGLVAMIWVLVALTETFVISGFGYALVQRQKATYLDECSAFYFNIVLSVIGCVLLWLVAPLVAGFYSEPALTALIRVLSLQLIVGAFGHVQLALLAKQINFKSGCQIDVAASITSGIVGIAMAFLGLGVWSLVGQQLSRVGVRASLAWYYSKWRPAWLFSFRSLRSMFRFGSSVLCYELVETVYRNIYSAVIGKFFSATDLGYYSRASRLQELPVQSMTTVVTGVAFPVFSQVQHDKVRLKNGLRACLGLLALAILPAMTGSALCAKPLIVVLFTEKWLPCVPYFQMLCIVGAVYPFNMLYAKVLLALGESRLFFWLSLFQRVLIVASIVVTYRWGIRGLVGGQIVGCVISTLLTAEFTGRLVKYRLAPQLLDVLPYVLLSAVVGISVWVPHYLRSVSNIWLLLSQLLAAAVMGLLFSYLLRLPAFVFICTQVRERIQSRHAAQPS